MSELPDTSLQVRWMIRRDMPEVMQIEQDSQDYPWPEEDLINSLRQRNCLGMVAELGNQVVGYMIYELHQSKLHIVKFAVHPRYWRKRVGLQMVNTLLEKLSSNKLTQITLTLRETNLAAQLFFKRAGFLATGVAREYFPDTGEDAYLMDYEDPGIDINDRNEVQGLMSESYYHNSELAEARYAEGEAAFYQDLLYQAGQGTPKGLAKLTRETLRRSRLSPREHFQALIDAGFINERGEVLIGK